MDSMRYLFAALIAVALIIFTVDIAQDRSDQPEQAEAFIGLADLQGKLSDAHLEPDKEIIAGRRVLPLAARDSEPYAVSADDGTSSEDNAVTGSPLGYAEAPLLPKQVCEAIRSAAEQNRIPFGFFARLLWQESKFRTEEISAAGAIGIAQFMPQTAAEVGLSDPFDPLQAIPASAKFLRKLHDQFGNLGLAAAAYNAGGGRIEKWLSRRGPLPPETRAYVKIITGNKAEDWTAESKRIFVPTGLPRQAPCDGAGGLSRSKPDQVAEVPVTLTSFVSEMLRKAEADEAAR
jgi:soluble lytic murein transglycosylase-like protein